MRRRTRLLILAAAAGLIVPTAITSSPASAVDQDLALSVVAGPAGTVVSATSASCAVADSEEGFGYLSVRLLSGTGADEVLAGIGLGIDDQAASFVVPDWVDPADPAVVEAACITIDISSEVPTAVSFAYDPIAFDVEAAAGAPVQASTYSRTSLLAGQAFQVDGSGCFLDHADSAYVEVAQGSDLSFRTASNFVALGANDVDADTFSVPTGLTNGGYNVSIVEGPDARPVVGEIEEIPTDIPAGTYTSISYCSNQDGVNLMFPPQLIEVTGDAPFGDIDLTVPVQSHTATLDGGSCTSGDAYAELYSSDIDDEFSGTPIDAALAHGNAVRSQSPAATSALRGPSRAHGVHRANDAWARSQGAGASRDRVGEGDAAGTITPGPDGSWTAVDEVTFDNALVEAYASCGDPLADGFIYDAQAAAVLVTPQEATTTTTATTSTTPPAPVAANAVKGTPTYAG